MTSTFFDRDDNFRPFSGCIPVRPGVLGYLAGVLDPRVPLRKMVNTPANVTSINDDHTTHH